MKARARRIVIAASGLLLGVLAMAYFHQEFQPTSPVAVIPSAPRDVIPPGIVVTESGPAFPPPSVASAPGDRLLGDYGNPALSPKNDLVLMARSISDFLILDKQAIDRPLSANEEWSEALRGLRPGNGPWFTETTRVFDSQHRIIDRWGTPLFFHALGGKRWQIRSAGPDRQQGSDDDLVENVSG